MRLQSRITSLISSSTAEEKDIGNIAPTRSEVSDALNEGSTRRYRLADAVSNQAVDLTGLSSVSYIYLRTNRDITLRLNGTEDIAVGIIEGFSYGYLQVCFPSGTVTTLDISNASGGIAVVLLQVAGEPT